jgi:uncharacterized protein YjbI with pentapeptide repeats
MLTMSPTVRTLINADLSGASLRGADLSGAYLQDARLDGAEMRGAVLHGDNFSEATMSKVMALAEQVVADVS